MLCSPCVPLTEPYALARAGVARFAQRYPALLDALLRSVLELVCKYHKTGGCLRLSACVRGGLSLEVRRLLAGPFRSRTVGD